MCISSCVSALLKSSFVNPVVMVTVSNIARTFSIVELYIPDTIIFVTELLENLKVFFKDLYSPSPSVIFVFKLNVHNHYFKNVTNRLSLSLLDDKLY